MNIIEAVREAMDKGKFITREIFKDVILFKPTDSGSACFVTKVTYNGRTSTGHRWNPNADDILADDWMIVD